MAQTRQAGQQGRRARKAVRPTRQTVPVFGQQPLTDLSFTSQANLLNVMSTFAKQVGNV